MIDLYKATHKPMFDVTVNVIRHGCRIAAKRARKKGDYDRVKRWNDTAYNGDVTLQAIREW